MLFAAILFCGITGHSHAQKWALKTNTLSWAVLAPNIGAELGLSGKVSMELSGSYKPWTVLDKSNIRLWYKKRPDLPCAKCSVDKTRNYFGPTKIFLSVSYLF